MGGSRGGDRVSGPPLKNHKIKGFLAILAWIAWNITKLPSQHSLLGNPRPASETPFNWHFVAGLWCPLIVVFVWILSPLNPPPLQKTPKKRQSWTPSGKTFWIRACSAFKGCLGPAEINTQDCDSKLGALIALPWLASTTKSSITLTIILRRGI